jgi:hypothetical protein
MSVESVSAVHASSLRTRKFGVAPRRDCTAESDNDVPCPVSESPSSNTLRAGSKAARSESKVSKLELLFSFSSDGAAQYMKIYSGHALMDRK